MRLERLKDRLRTICIKNFALAATDVRAMGQDSICSLLLGACNRIGDTALTPLLGISICNTLVLVGSSDFAISSAMACATESASDAASCFERLPTEAPISPVLTAVAIAPQVLIQRPVATGPLDPASPPLEPGIGAHPPTPVRQSDIVRAGSALRLGIFCHKQEQSRANPKEGDHNALHVNSPNTPESLSTRMSSSLASFRNLCRIRLRQCHAAR